MSLLFARYLRLNLLDKRVLLRSFGEQSRALLTRRHGADQLNGYLALCSVLLLDSDLAPVNCTASLLVHFCCVGIAGANQLKGVQKYRVLIFTAWKHIQPTQAQPTISPEIVPSPSYIIIVPP